jgi:hypothetical protein
MASSYGRFHRFVESLCFPRTRAPCKLYTAPAESGTQQA